MNKLNTLIVGNLADCEFDDAVSRICESGEAQNAASVDEAINLLRDPAKPIDLIVIAVSHPWQFAPSEIQRLLEECPIVPKIALMGSWLEGHHRTEASWRNITSVYWHEWPAFWERESNRFIQNGQPAWNLPSTSTREELFSSALAAPLPESDSQPDHAARLVALCGMPYETSEAMAEVISYWGHASVWLPRTGQGTCLRGVSAMLWEGVAADSRELEQLSKYRERLGQPPTVALLDFPRPDTLKTVREAGADFVLGKPLLIPDLISSLNKAIELGKLNQRTNAKSQHQAAA